MKYHDISMKITGIFRKFLSLKTLLCASFSLAALVQLSANFAQSEERLPELKTGMTYLEVIKLWGSPVEKIEYEIKRKDVWVYKRNKLVFVNGHLAAIQDVAGKNTLTQAALIEEKKEVKNIPLQPAGSTKPDQDVVDDILSEIMKDPSNSDGDPKSSNAGPGAAPNMINAVPPPEIN